jgi:hypothetical protein
MLVDDAPIISSTRTELELSRGQVVVVQRLGAVVRITTARRVKRSVTDSLVTGGTVLLPIDHLPEIFAEIVASSHDVD